MKIEYLCDNTHFIATVADWIYGEFIRDIRRGITYENILSAIGACSKDALPVRLVAVCGGRCAGTVSIVQNDLECRDYAPWVAALYVDVSFRNQKIGEKLLDRAKGIAAEMGYDEIFLRTEHAGNYYRRLGWRYVESCEDEFGLIPEVFKHFTNR